VASPPSGDPQLGARLRELRLAKGVGLKVIANRADISLPYLSEVERGLKLPSLEVLARVASALDSDVVAVLRGLPPYDKGLTPPKG
jgi:transcriptional regulator with XRE-family HTH domain